MRKSTPSMNSRPPAFGGAISSDTTLPARKPMANAVRRRAKILVRRSWAGKSATARTGGRHPMVDRSISCPTCPNTGPSAGRAGHRFPQAWRRLTAGVLAAGVACAVAAAAIETRPIQFAKGASSATVQGTIQGYQTIDYTVRARAGQTMSVKLETTRGANYFNVLPPGSNDVAIFVGSSGGNEWSGKLPADGEYKLRVYLMRSAARRHESASYTLTVGVTGSAGAAVPALGAARPGDAKVAGTRYHATGPLPCALGNAPMGSTQCEFGVVRGKPGNAEMHIKPAGGLERVLSFRGNTVTSGNDKVKATKAGDLWTIEVNDYEHYQVSESVISGG
jgi:hypothetical protein